LRRYAAPALASPVNHAAIAERKFAPAPDAVMTDRRHELAAELVERRLLAA
jgi:hypothetical protein